MDKHIYTATDLQRNLFAIMREAKEKGEVTFSHRSLGEFKVTPTESEGKFGKRFGGLAHHFKGIDLDLSFLDGREWSDELADMFDVNNEDPS